MTTRGAGRRARALGLTAAPSSHPFAQMPEEELDARAAALLYKLLRESEWLTLLIAQMLRIALANRHQIVFFAVWLATLVLVDIEQFPRSRFRPTALCLRFDNFFCPVFVL